MTTIHDTIKALLEERATCATRIEAIDRELASVHSTVSAAIATLAPPPAAPAAPPPATRAASSRGHDQANRIAVHAVRFEREIKTALVGGALSLKAIAKACGQKRDDIKRSVKRMFAAGTLTKIGKRGPAVRWQLATGQGVGARLRAAAAAPQADEFETVFPKPGDPKASPREAIESAGAHA